MKLTVVGLGFSPGPRLARSSLSGWILHCCTSIRRTRLRYAYVVVDSPESRSILPSLRNACSRRGVPKYWLPARLHERACVASSQFYPCVVFTSQVPGSTALHQGGEVRTEAFLFNFYTAVSLEWALPPHGSKQNFQNETRVTVVRPSSCV